MKISKKQLTLIIDNYLYEQEEDTGEWEYDPEAEEETYKKEQERREEVQRIKEMAKKYSTRIEKIYQQTLQIAKDRHKRRLLSNPFLNRVRNELIKVLPDEIKVYTGVTKDTLVNLIVPKDRKELLNPKENTFNIYPDVMQIFDNFCEDIEKRLFSTQDNIFTDREGV